MMSEPNIALSLITDKMYCTRGSSIDITASSSEAQMLIQIVNPSDAIIYEQTWTSNTTRTIPISASAAYGDYIIRGTPVGTLHTTELLFSVVSITGWSSVTSFPHTKVWHTIEYQFTSDWKVIVNGKMEIDFSALRSIVNQYNATVTATKNDNAFRLHIEHATAGISIDLIFFFIWKGAKFVVSGTLDTPRTIQFSVSNPERLKDIVHGTSVDNIVFDWSDIHNVGHAFTYADGILSVDIPQTFTLDPTIYGAPASIDLTTSQYATNTAHRGGGWANGRFWYIYHDGVNMLYTSAGRGQASGDWATPVSWKSGVYERDVCFGGNYVHVVYSNRTSNTPVYYARGLCQSNGVIIWDSEQTAVTNVASTFPSYPTIDVDSTGHVYIGYGWGTSSNLTPYVTKNNNTDGTWSVASGYPYQLSTSVGTYYRVEVCVLANDAILCGYAPSSAAELKIKMYDGSWNTERASGNTLYLYNSFYILANSLDNNANIILSVTGNTYHRIYTYSTNTIETATVLYAGSTYQGAAIDSQTDDLYVSLHSSTITLRKYTKATATWVSGNTWESGVDWYSSGYLTFAKDATHGVFAQWEGALSGSDYPIYCMVTRLSDDFETGAFTYWTSSGGGTKEVVDGSKMTKSYGAHFTAAAASSALIYKDYSDFDTIYTKFRFRLNTAPAAGGTADICYHMLIAGTVIGKLIYDKDLGTFKITDNTTGGTTANGTTTITTGVWYTVEFGSYLAASTGWMKLWVNGTLDASITGVTNNESVNATRVQIGICAASGATNPDISIDDAACDIVRINDYETKPTLWDNYITNDDDETTTYGATWKAQTFTVASSAKITSARIKVKKVGTGDPGTITLSIKAVDGSNKPTGSDLTSGTYPGIMTLTTTGGTWIEFMLTEYPLSAGTMYSVVVRATSGTSLNYINWREDITSPTLSNGNYLTSAASGSTWTADTGKDLIFELWGDAPESYSRTAAGALTRTASAKRVLGAIRKKISNTIAMVGNALATLLDPSFLEDFESTDKLTYVNNLTSSTSNASDTAYPLSGTQDLKTYQPINTTTNTYYNHGYYSLGGAQTSGYVYAGRIRFDQLPGSGYRFWFIGTGHSGTMASAGLCYAGLADNGTDRAWIIRVWTGAALTEYVGTYKSIPVNTNYELEVYVTNTNDSNNIVRLWVDGYLEIEVTGINSYASGRTLSYVGFGYLWATNATAVNFYFDDVGFSTTKVYNDLFYGTASASLTRAATALRRNVAIRSITTDHKHQIGIAARVKLATRKVTTDHRHHVGTALRVKLGIRSASGALTRAATALRRLLKIRSVTTDHRHQTASALRVKIGLRSASGALGRAATAIRRLVLTRNITTDHRHQVATAIRQLLSTRRSTTDHNHLAGVSSRIKTGIRAAAGALARSATAKRIKLGIRIATGALSRSASALRLKVALRSVSTDHFHDVGTAIRRLLIARSVTTDHRHQAATAARILSAIRKITTDHNHLAGLTNRLNALLRSKSETIANSPSGTVLMAHMNEGSGVTVNDSSGNENTGTKYGFDTPIFDGSFENGQNVYGFTSGGSYGTNDIITFLNPGLSGYVLRQQLAGEYEMLASLSGVPTEAATEYVMSCWVSYTSDYNGTDQIMHLRWWEGDGTPQSFGGSGHLIETRVVNGITWEYRYETFTTTTTVNGELAWYLGYAGGATVGYRYLTNIRLEKGSYPSPRTYTTFNGTDEYIDFGNASTLNLGSKFTISVWIKPPVGGAVGGLLSKGTYANGFDIAYGGSGANFRVDGFSDNPDHWQDMHIVNDVWQLFTITFDTDLGSDNLKFYRNNVLEGTWSITGGIESNSSPLVMAKYVDGDVGWWEGSVDDLRLFNRAISSIEIDNLYRDGAARLLQATRTDQEEIIDTSNANRSLLATRSNDETIINAPSNVLALYHMEESSGSYIYDSSGNNHIGTMDAYTSRVGGKTGNAVEFTGNTGEGSIYLNNPSTLFPGMNSLSVVGWFYHNSYEYPRSVMCIGAAHDASNSEWMCGHGHTTNGIILRWADGTNIINTALDFDEGSRPADFLNRWVHLAIVFDRGTGYAKAYVDGVKQSTELNISSVTGSVVGAGGSMVISGCWGWRLGGKADDISIHNKALTSTEIEDMYRATADRLLSITRSNTTDHVHVAGVTGRLIGIVRSVAGSLTRSALAKRVLMAIRKMTTDHRHQTATASRLKIALRSGAGALTRTATALRRLVATRSSDGTIVNALAGTVLLLHLEEGIGTVAKDSSGNGNDGLLLPNGTEPTWTSGKYGSGLQFGTNNNYVRVVGTSASLTLDSVSIGYWVYINSITAYAEGVRNEGSYILQWSTNGMLRPHVNIEGGWEIIESVAGAVVAGVWQHHSMSYNQNTRVFKGYINGVEVCSRTITGKTDYTLSAPSAYTFIGSGSPDAEFLNGIMDEVIIINRGLNESEIQDLYKAGASRLLMTTRSVGVNHNWMAVAVRINVNIRSVVGSLTRSSTALRRLVATRLISADHRHQTAIAARVKIGLRTTTGALARSATAIRRLAAQRLVSVDHSHLTGAVSRFRTFTRSITAALHPVAIAKRVIYAIRNSSALIDVHDALVDQILIYTRAASATLSRSAVTVRRLFATRTKTSSLSITGITRRLTVLIKGATAAIHPTAVASRLKLALRNASISLGRNAAAKRVIGATRSTTSSLFVGGVSRRLSIIIRSVSSSLGRTGSTIRRLSLTRSAAGLTQILADALTEFTQGIQYLTRTASAAIQSATLTTRRLIAIRVSYAALTDVATTVRRLIASRIVSTTIVSIGAAKRVLGAFRVSSGSLMRAALSVRRAAISRISTSSIIMAGAVGRLLLITRKAISSLIRTTTATRQLVALRIASASLLATAAASMFGFIFSRSAEAALVLVDATSRYINWSRVALGSIITAAETNRRLMAIRAAINGTVIGSVAKRVSRLIRVGGSTVIMTAGSLAQRIMIRVALVGINIVGGTTRRFIALRSKLSAISVMGTAGRLGTFLRKGIDTIVDIANPSRYSNRLRITGATIITLAASMRRLVAIRSKIAVLTLVDMAESIRSFIRTAAITLTQVANPVRYNTILRAVASSIIVSSNTLRKLLLERVGRNFLYASATALRILRAIRVVEAQANLVDMTKRVYASLRSNVAGLTIIDSVKRSALFVRGVPSAALVAAVAGIARIFIRIASASMNLTDNVQRLLSLMRSSVVYLSLVEQASRLGSFIRRSVTALMIKENSIRSIVTQRIGTATMIITDQTSRFYIFMRSAVDSLLIVPVGSRITTLIRLAQNGVTLVDAAIRSVIIERIASEAVIFVAETFATVAIVYLRIAEAAINVVEEAYGIFNPVIAEAFLSLYDRAQTLKIYEKIETISLYTKSAILKLLKKTGILKMREDL